MRWTPEEDAILESGFYANMSNEEIAALLPNRTANAVSIRLSNKKLTSKQTIRARGTENIVGNRYGQLVVVEQAGISKSGSRTWLCQCDCGGTTIVPGYHLKRNNVRSCGCLKKRAKNPAWKGHGDIGQTVWKNYERSAKKRNIPFELTIEEGWELFKQQNGRCYFTGQEISFDPPKGKRHGTASLDRYDSTKGYTKDNCVWVHKDINRFKNDYSVEQFLSMCRMVTEHCNNMK